jgi:mono/diheme cytochrome c family protein
MSIAGMISLLAVLAVAGLSLPMMAASSQGNTESGKKIYLESCQSCHGPTGKGDSDVAAFLKPPPSNLTAKSTQSRSDAELRMIIVKGRPGTSMASFDGVFDEVQLTDLIAYIRSIGS